MTQNKTTILPGKKKFIYAVAPAIVTIINAVAVQCTGQAVGELPAEPSANDLILASLDALRAYIPSIVTWVTGMFALSKENSRDIKRAENEKEVNVEYEKARPEIERAINEARQAEQEAATEAMSLEDFQESLVRPYAIHHYGSDLPQYLLYAAQMKLRKINPPWKGNYLINLAKRAFLHVTGYTYEEAKEKIEKGTMPQCTGGTEMDQWTLEIGIGAYSVWQELEALLDKYGKG